MSNHKLLENFDGDAIGENLLAQLHAEVKGAADFSQLAPWLSNNTSDPRDPDKPWTFAEHEYQIDILNSTHHEEFYQKCSQVGASELFVRMKLAMLGVAKAMTIIYVLPTRTFALRFAKGRVDPVINSSKALKAMLNKDVDSSEMKQFGNSFLYITGSFGQSSAISIPAQGLFWDEVDFCDQQNLTTFRSRMGHVKDDDVWFVRGFSTPTVYDYGINAFFKKGSQAFYAVYCHTCHDYVEVDFMRDIVVPGYERDMREWDKSCLDDPRLNIDGAFFRCSCCSNPLPWANFLDPAKRKWIHRFPSREIKSRQISPFDVPAINYPARTLRHVGDYEVTADWVNFKVGVPHEDASSSFLVEKANWGDGVTLEPPLTPAELNKVLEEKNLIDNLEGFIEWLSTQPVIAGSMAAGMDVGKMAWITVLHVEDHSRKLIYAERVVASGGHLTQRFLYIMHTFGGLSGVVDAGPDFSTSQTLSRVRRGQIWACYYATNRDNQLQRIKLDESEGTVSVLRTRTFDMLVRAFNDGKLTMAKLREEAALRAHLKALKRVTVVKDEGEKGNIEKARWVSTGDDHFTHSLLYANLAADLIYSQDGLEAYKGKAPVSGAEANIGKVRMRR